MIIVAGGTGLVGKNIVKELRNKEILVLTRNRKHASVVLGGLGGKVTAVEWGEVFEEKWIEKIRAESERVIVNLAGENIGRPWTKEAKRKIMESRIRVTRDTVELAERVKAQKLINASAIGFYGDTKEEERDETSPPGNMFLSRVCEVWEREAMRVRSSDLYIMRIGFVLDRGAKMLRSLVTPFFIVNPFGRGVNFVSWIHSADLARIVRSIIEDAFKIDGGYYVDGVSRRKVKSSAVVINCVSPNPVRSGELVETMAKIKGKKVISVPQILFAIVFGRDFVKEMISVSQRIKPTFLLENGFTFRYADLGSALRDVLG